ncbi:pyruvate formate lyase-activating protein [Clostridium sp. MSJ-11]|uniref:Pyruvate formate-lyase-activating enzyme n=1 Tax=Clostridium mobile TaxID=2841512 RepID=A0ABS6EKB2_9CLOT|nr:pyruvate formate-lyase-activating protein [Clostridium mobile]MBU5484854.1 pyruvate formate lyase-activating protein [Clostridium mobile]
MGRIHSIETMGLVDGPGIRTVVFFQGCHLNCVYCHNPDTWNVKEGYDISSKDLVNKIIRYKPYYRKSNGGVTLSGGECLLQEDFLIEVLKKCKKEGIHTAIDTSGYGKGNYDEILKYTDLVILDIKHVDDDGYREITSYGIEELERFIKSLNKNSCSVWIRHVVIPGITDNEEHILKLKEKISNIKNLEKIELLPYHSMGEYKYEQLKIPYKLKGIKDIDDELIIKLDKIINKK